MSGAEPEAISTHCRETEVLLDETHTASRLGDCGDPAAPNALWHLDRIDQTGANLDGLYHRRHGGAGSVVYIMDTGVMAGHNEFATPAGPRVIAGFDTAKSVTIGASRCPSANKALAPCYDNFNELTGASHGTSVASLVAGARVGVAPEASIVSIRVMNESALATTRTYLDGLNAIIRHAWDPATPPFHTAVVNISGWVLERLQGQAEPAPVPFATLEKKIREMVAGVDATGKPDPNGKKFLFVVAGNNVDNGCGRNGVVDRFPATLGRAIDGVITVGGMTAENSWWPGACRGGIEILAPSEGVLSATITAKDEYRGTRPNLRSGTSFAAPIISGIAARLLSEQPALTPAQLEQIIVATPSRIFNPDAQHADGKVAFVIDAPAVLSAGGTDKAEPKATPAARTVAVGAPMSSAGNRP
ncbi:MAG TPA: S8 family serine peptidase [Thermoanaerobaculia bacterium]|nr:S8 family serine peptidase [Thermoanaerobaculia bacterium]